MIEKTPREILDAIDKALEETAARLDSIKPKPVLYPILPNQLAIPRRPKTPEEVLDTIDRALEETARRIAERGY